MLKHTLGAAAAAIAALIAAQVASPPAHALPVGLTLAPFEMQKPSNIEPVAMRRWHYRGGYGRRAWGGRSYARYRGRHYHGHRYYGHYGYPWGYGAVGLGYYGGYAGYGAGYDGYDGSYDDGNSPVEGHVQWCLNRYRSYDPRTDAFLGYDGLHHRCAAPY